jgi:hypothetical protein
MDIHDVRKKLIGPIRPVGCSSADKERLENLKELTKMTAEILDDIYSIYTVNSGSYESSRQVAAKHIKEFFKDNADYFEDFKGEAQ